MKSLVVIWGAGGHAQVVADILESVGHYSLTGFLDDVSPERAGSKFAGRTILGGEEQLPNLAKSGVALLPGVGDCGVRLRIMEAAEQHGCLLATALHRTVTIATDVRIGDGTVAAAGVIVNPAATIGRCVILNTACSVDHHGEIADGVHIGPGARLGGGVRVGRGAWVGIGAVVRENITIGAEAIVGAGAVVIRDVPPDVIVVGNPARFLKNNPRATHSS
jgi:acetyltransferase EpsM